MAFDHRKGAAFLAISRLRLVLRLALRRSAFTLRLSTLFLLIGFEDEAEKGGFVR